MESETLRRASKNGRHNRSISSQFCASVARETRSKLRAKHHVRFDSPKRPRNDQVALEIQASRLEFPRVDGRFLDKWREINVHNFCDITASRDVAIVRGCRFLALTLATLFQSSKICRRAVSILPSTTTTTTTAASSSFN